MFVTKLVRPEVRHFQAYLPGKPIEEVQRELGLKKIVKLASNENAMGASPKAVSALAKSARSAFRYPEGPGTLLRRALAARLKIFPTEVMLGAGSDEIIEIFGKTFLNREDEIVVSEHAFVRYAMAADLMGAKTIAVPMKDGRHNLEAMAECVGPRTKAVFIANPNNPTGTYVGRDEVARFFDKVPYRASDQWPAPFLIFDEAYYEFARTLAPDYPETIDIFRKDPRVIVLRTFSKIYGLAGLRVGYGVAADQVVEAMDRVRPPFNVSSPAQAAALAALSDAGHVKRSAAAAKHGLAYLARELRALGLPFLPSVGNFLLVDVSPRAGREVFQALVRAGVIVRAMDEYGFPGRVRVSVGRPDENRFFIQQLKKVLSSGAAVAPGRRGAAAKNRP